MTRLTLKCLIVFVLMSGPATAVEATLVERAQKGAATAQNHDQLFKFMRVRHLAGPLRWDFHHPQLEMGILKNVVGLQAPNFTTRRRLDHKLVGSC
jgi:hypothetical protein